MFRGNKFYKIDKNGKNSVIELHEPYCSNIIIRTTDSHSILDKGTGEVLNEGKDIKIGNNCWLTTGVKVLKGVHISDNIIVGLDSIVNKNLENEFSVYAGTPAKLVKTNVIWNANPPIKN